MRNQGMKKAGPTGHQIGDDRKNRLSTGRPNGPERLVLVYEQASVTQPAARAKPGRGTSRGRRLSVKMGAAVALAMAVLAGFSVSALSTPRGLTAAAAQSSSVSITQQQQAISFARQYIGSSHYDGLCLQFVNDAWRSAGVPLASSSTAYTYWTTNPNHWQENASPGSYNAAPAGALLFWGPNPWNSDGHVAIAADSSGDVISSAAYPYYDKINDDPRGLEFNVSARSAMTYHYLGWMMPGVTAASAPIPTPVPAPSPAPTPAPSPAPAPVIGTPPSPSQTAVPTTSSTTTPPTTKPSPTSPPGSSTPLSPTAPSTNESPAPAGVAAPTTYGETTGGDAHTWSNPANAGGSEGPTIPGQTMVQIACKTAGFAVADGNTWWYQIAQNPWNGTFYVSADAFYNNGESSGSLQGTPFVDTSVPNC
jgi:hypothetical protein